MARSNNRRAQTPKNNRGIKAAEAFALAGLAPATRYVPVDEDDIQKDRKVSRRQRQQAQARALREW